VYRNSTKYYDDKECYKKIDFAEYQEIGIDIYGLSMTIGFCGLGVFSPVIYDTKPFSDDVMRFPPQIVIYYKEIEELPHGSGFKVKVKFPVKIKDKSVNFGFECDDADITESRIICNYDKDDTNPMFMIDARD
jgi:hypothetical protein